MAVGLKADKDVKKPDVKTFTMYNGNVLMEFNPNSPRYRYTVTDRAASLSKEPIRGVTTLLGDIVAKPDLMTWPMNMSHGKLFGSKFDEKILEYVHNWDEAELKPDTPYTSEQLHEAMMAGSREYTKRSDKGKDVGTVVHAMIENYLKNKKYTIPEDMPEDQAKMSVKAFESFAKWWRSLKGAAVIENETPVYSRRMRYAGTMDLVAQINGKSYLLDIKTTNVSRKAPLGIYAEYFLQLAGYSYAFREEHGLRVDDLGIIRVGKDGRLNIVTAHDLGLSVDDCERAFGFACRLHDWLEKASKFLSDGRTTSHLNPVPKVEAELANNNMEVKSV